VVREEQPCACAIVAQVIATEKALRKQEQRLVTLKKKIINLPTKAKKSLHHEKIKIQKAITTLHRAKSSATQHLSKYEKECAHEP
jgi:hypothetical protein